MLWEENIKVNEKSNTTIHYRIVKDGMDVKRGMLTPGDVNAFLPVVAKTKHGFLVAYLMERNNHVGIYLSTL
jgi:hypothetical protein